VRAIEGIEQQGSGKKTTIASTEIRDETHLRVSSKMRGLNEEQLGLIPLLDSVKWKAFIWEAVLAVLPLIHDDNGWPVGFQGNY
jgi:hypothetical protein